MIRHPDGRPYLISGSIQDIHARKQAEETIRRQGEYLVQKQKMEALGELAGEVAHEFNNALHAINGQIQFAYSSAVEQSTTKKDLEVATLLIKEAAQFTRQLLDFGRPHCCELRTIPIKGVLKRARNVLGPLLGGAIDLQFRCNKKCGYISADPVLLQQALINLCINARDAMQNGGTLCVASKRVKLREHDLVKFPGASPGNYTLITVTDTGCGMTEAQQARIFEPYYTTKATGKGTGLGLAIVYRIVQEHHGLICCESRLGRGTMFSIWLPSSSHELIRRQRVKPAALSRSRALSETIASHDGRDAAKP
jgi:signal transduction histidine kinase